MLYFQSYLQFVGYLMEPKKTLGATPIERFKYLLDTAQSIPNWDADRYSSQWLHDEKDVAIYLVRLLYESNREQVREWLLKTVEEYKFVRATREDRERRYPDLSKGNPNAIGFFVWFVRSIDPSLLDEVYEKFLGLKKFNSFFWLEDHWSVAELLFGTAPARHKKNVFDRIVAATKAHYPSRYRLVLGRFVYERLNVRAEFRQNFLREPPYYFEFFDAMTAEEKAEQGTWYEQYVKTLQPFDRIDSNVLEPSRWILKLYPKVENTVESYVLSCVEKMDPFNNQLYDLKSIEKFGTERMRERAAYILFKNVVKNKADLLNDHFQIPEAIPDSFRGPFHKYLNLV